ncbi:hypothetical protein [Bacillus mycoides]|uniref:hypothetical protein n=1 Tax=Bacillus mycoides TaxID=1405 RepID=UPI003D66149E
MTEIVKIEELNTFLPLASLEALPVEEQKMRLQYWKEHFSIKEILEGLGTYKNKLYDLYKKHEITTQGHMQAKRKGKEKTTPKEDTPNNLQYGCFCPSPRKGGWAKTYSILFQVNLLVPTWLEYQLH